MTEQEWLASTDPQGMLAFVAAGPRHGTWGPLVSDRKLRLFACACCRQVWHLLTDERNRRAVEVAERYADSSPDWLAHLTCGLSSAAECAWEASRVHTLLYDDQHEARAVQAALLRCVVGNPFRPVEGWKRCVRDESKLMGGNKTVSGHPDPTVYHLAQSVYDDRAFECLPILADALEEAGCEAEVACERCGGGGTVLAPYRDGWHKDMCVACNGTGRVPNPVIANLRGPGPHARGCWAVDLILGKE